MVFGKDQKSNYWKGKHRSTETKSKLSLVLKGKKRSEETREKISVALKGIKNPNKITYGFRGKTHSKETKLKISLKCRGTPKPSLRGKLKSEEHKKKISNAKKGIPSNRKQTKHTAETLLKISQSRMGKCMADKNPAWNGGTSFLPYCYKFNKRLKETIRNRDNHTCQLCGTKENGRKHCCHHVHYDKPNCEPDLITLCHKCNLKVNINRDYYENYFMVLINKGGNNEIIQRN